MIRPYSTLVVSLLIAAGIILFLYAAYRVFVLARPLTESDRIAIKRAIRKLSRKSDELKQATDAATTKKG